MDVEPNTCNTAKKSKENATQAENSAVNNTFQTENSAVSNAPQVERIETEQAKKPAKQKPDKNVRNNKIWIIVLSALAVVIVGLIIAIIIVKMAPNEESDEMMGTELTEAQQEFADAYSEYEGYQDAISGEIDEKIQNGETNYASVYLKYIDETKNDETRALLYIDYYSMLMVEDTVRSRKDEVIGGMISADDALRSSASASAVIMAATFYNDSDVLTKYTLIMEERKANGVITELEEVLEKNEE